MSTFNFKELEAQCKWYEKNFSLEKMIPHLPVILRFDGNNFSSWTRKLTKPFDERFVRVMERLTEFLVHETGAMCGYHQSDEITLILRPKTEGGGGIYHEGKKQKILSKLTSKATINFNEFVREEFDGVMSVGIFDCRLYQVPTLEIALDQIIWRQMDGIRNSKQAFAHARLGHKAILNKSTTEMIEMVYKETGEDWNKLPLNHRNGQMFVNRIKTTPFTPEEIEKLPPKHNYFRNPSMVIERKVISKLTTFNFSSFGLSTVEFLHLITDTTIDQYKFQHYLTKLLQNNESMLKRIASQDYSIYLLYEFELLHLGISKLKDEYYGIQYPSLVCGPTMSYDQYKLLSDEQKEELLKGYYNFISAFISLNFKPYYLH